jgi:MFS family permease
VEEPAPGAAALFGLVAGQAVVWYTGQFYTLFFLTKVLQVDLTTANILIAVALLIGTPFFVVFGALSDRVGRKPIIMAGLLLAVLTYFPLFHALTQAANPDLALAQAKAEVVVTAARRDCSFGGNPVARAIDFRTSCDIAKRLLAQNSVSYKNASAMGGHATVRIGDRSSPRPRAGWWARRSTPRARPPSPTSRR